MVLSIKTIGQRLGASLGAIWGQSTLFCQALYDEICIMPGKCKNFSAAILQGSDDSFTHVFHVNCGFKAGNYVAITVN